MKKKVLFVCIHNSARSQMAEEYLKTMGGDRYEVESAGLEPTDIHPLTIEVMKEEGIDLSYKKTYNAFDFYKAGKSYDFVVVVCDRETEERCPSYPGAEKHLYWPFDDPSKAEGTHEEKLAVFREVRNRVKIKIEAFVEVFG